MTANTRRLVIVGASGMVGGYALRFALEDQAASFLSGSGADQTGRSRIPFARYKGQAESALLAAGFPTVYLFRPGYIYPVAPRREPTLAYRALRVVYPALRVLLPNQVIPADDLAWAMVDVAVEGTGDRHTVVVENRDIKAYVATHRAALAAPVTAR